MALVDGLDLGTRPDRMLVADSDALRGLATGRSDRSGRAADRLRPTPDELYLLIFTSGSTGGPKAVRMTQGRAARAAAGMGFTSEDVLYSAMPLFHGNALSAAVLPAFASGATLALRRRFSASGFLPDVRAIGATFFNTVGRAIAHIVATPPTEHDRDHRLRYVLGPETSAPDKAAFTERFGVPVFEGYGSSENAIVLQPVPDGPTRAPWAGPATRDDVAVVDPATGEERPRAVFDADGRLTNAGRGHRRAGRPAALSNFEGYYNNPEADAERTRNGWYWSGRPRPTGTRRGSSTSPAAPATGSGWTARTSPPPRWSGSWPGSRGSSGVAVYPVPDSRTGDQVMAALELEPGASFDPGRLRRLPGRPAGPGHQVGAPLRADGRPPFRSPPPTRWTRSRCGPSGGSTDDPVWHRAGRSDEYVPLTPADIDRAAGGVRRQRAQRAPRAPETGSRFSRPGGPAWPGPRSPGWSGCRSGSPASSVGGEPGQELLEEDPGLQPGQAGARCRRARRIRRPGGRAGSGRVTTNRSAVGPKISSSRLAEA